MSNEIIEFEDLGVMPYRQTWDLQKSLFTSLIEDKKAQKTTASEKVFFVEHPHVYTLGLHGKVNNMLLNPTDLEHRGIEFVQIERGGDITYHGPGQLVVYPILDMQKYSLGVKSYIDLLEETVIRVIAKYGIKGERVEGATGVWIDVGTPRERKICAIGVKCSRFVTMHGLALNVNTDLSYFSAINPCGFIDKGVTSISRELGHDIDMIEVKNLFKSIFINLLSDRV